mmetsp:Transcript_8607/g.35869  ORF Transcript_8607/g.35869 Transcript_8607/m.35869 type:complete len:472 (+) Transcript_8607:201-1616(+)
MFKTARKKDLVRFIQAAKDGQLADLKDVVLKCKVDFVDKRDEQDWSALFWATFNGHFDVVKYLVEVMSADVTQVDTQGRSALYLSCGWGGESGESGELTKFLIDSGADISLVTTDGWSPLYLTAFRGKANAAEHLLAAGADLLQCDSKGRSPLAIAKATKHGKMVPILTKAAVSRMFDATREGKSSVLQTLIEEYGLDVNQRDEEGRTPLHVAMECGNEGAVKILVSCGADDTEKDAEGRTPQEIAVACGKRTVIAALQSAIEVREEQRKSRIILEKERLMLLKKRKESKELGAAEAGDEEGAGHGSSGDEVEAAEAAKMDAPGAGIMHFEISSYATKILSKVPKGAAWRDIDQMLDDLDIVDDIVVEEPDLSDLLNWSVWELDEDDTTQAAPPSANGMASAGEAAPSEPTAKAAPVASASAASAASSDDADPAPPSVTPSSRRKAKRQADDSEETDDEYDESGDEEEPAW